MVEEMKVKEGYKKTEVGIIPEDWRVVTFGEAFSFLSTGNNSRSEIKEQGTIQYIHYGDIHTKWRYVLDCDKDNIPFIDEIKVKSLPKLEEGDLIIADASEDYEGIGVSVEIKNIKNRKIVSGLHTFLLRGDKRTFVDGFKGYIQAMKPVKNELRKIATGISVYGISKNNLKNVLIPVPTLSEQKAISKALSDIDNLITSLEKLIDKKQKIKQGTMQQLLTGKKRLPGFTGDWVIKKLGEIVNIRKGHQKNKDMLSNKGEYPVINGGIEPSGYTFDWNTEENTITISEGGNSCGYVNFIKTKFWSGGHCYTVQIKDDDLNNSFLYYLLKYYEIKIMALRVGSGLPNIQRKSIEEFEVTYIEGTQEQKAIAQILRDLDSEIEALEKKLEKYKAIKQGMMQELLTGRIRLV